MVALGDGERNVGAAGGHGYEEATASAGVEGGPDSYSVLLWPRHHDTEPALRRTWFGWADAQ